MSARKACLLQALGLARDLDDEDCTHAVSMLISRAATEASPAVTLRDVHDAVSQYASTAYLEPLDVLPALLPCRRDGAIDLIRLCAQNNSPKEVLIVLQEAIEHLQRCLNHEDDEEENTPELVQRTIGIVVLCAPAISRAKLDQRSAREQCSPILEDVTSLISAVAPLCSKAQGRLLITHVAGMVQCLNSWAAQVPAAGGLQGIKRLFREVLDTTVVGCAPSIQSCLAVRAARCHFQRAFLASSEEEERKDGDNAMLTVKLALESLGDMPETTASFSDLVYLAHSVTPLRVSPRSLPGFYRLLVSALQMNVVVDEALFLLVTLLTGENAGMSAEVATSLCTVLAALASTHLDATIRELNFRLLSLTLSKLPSPPRLEILLRLTTDEAFPQIRGPAVGLVKEAVLEALAFPLDSGNPFGSPELLRVFGSVLFRPNPPDFFSDKKTREEVAQSLEILRIADCLSFYYVLLQRDRENKTGARSKGHVTSVQRTLLGPLRRFLDEHVCVEEPPLMALLSLQVGLDRIDSALRTLSLDEDA